MSWPFEVNPRHREDTSPREARRARGLAAGGEEETGPDQDATAEVSVTSSVLITARKARVIVDMFLVTSTVSL